MCTLWRPFNEGKGETISGKNCGVLLFNVIFSKSAASLFKSRIFQYNTALNWLQKQKVDNTRLFTGNQCTITVLICGNICG